MNDDEASVDLQRLAFEREKSAQDFKLRRAELRVKLREQRARPFLSPLFLAVVAACIGVVGNAVLATLNSTNQRTLQRAQAEASLILEAIKTGDTESAASNLKFLVDARLISESSALEKYLKSRKPLEGPVLPVLPGPRTPQNGSFVERKAGTVLELRVKDTGAFEGYSVIVNGTVMVATSDEATHRYPIDGGNSDLSIAVLFAGPDGGKSAIVDVTNADSPLVLAQADGLSHSYLLHSAP